MTKPKVRVCPVCQAPNQLRVNTCTACASSLRPKLNSKQAPLRSGWAQSVLKNKNSSRVLNSAMFAMTKLNALGYQPILFMAKTSKSGQIKGDLIHFMQPERSSVEMLQNMHKLYEHLVQGQSTSASAQSVIKAEISSAPTPVSQIFFSPPQPPTNPTTVPTLTSYYVVPSPQPTGTAPGTALTPYYIIPATHPTSSSPVSAPASYYILPAVHPTGAAPVPAPTSYYFIPAPQPSGVSPVPAPTPYYLIPAPQSAGTTSVPAPQSYYLIPALQPSGITSVRAPQEDVPQTQAADATVPAPTAHQLSQGATDVQEVCVYSLQ